MADSRDDVRLGNAPAVDFHSRSVEAHDQPEALPGWRRTPHRVGIGVSLAAERVANVVQLDLGVLPPAGKTRLDLYQLFRHARRIPKMPSTMHCSDEPIVSQWSTSELPKSEKAAPRCGPVSPIRPRRSSSPCIAIPP